MWTSDKFVQYAIFSCRWEVMTILFHIGQLSCTQLFQVDLSFLGDSCGMKAFISYWSGVLLLVYMQNISIRCLLLMFFNSAESTILLIYLNVEQAMGYSYFHGYHWTLVRSDEYWWLDSTWANFRCWSSKVIFFINYMLQSVC